MADSLRDTVIEYSKLFWAKCPNDWCIQHDGEETIIFGSVNRVIWSIWTGFRIDKNSCTENFIKHFNETMS